MRKLQRSRLGHTGRLSFADLGATRQRGRRNTRGLARRLTIESLEGRLLLAADLQVSFEYLDSTLTPVSSLQVGQDYTMQTYVQDIRSSWKGVKQAYFNLNYDSARATFNAPIVVADGFSNNNKPGSLSTGLVADVGGQDIDMSPPDPESPVCPKSLLFSVGVHADSAGTLTLTPSMVTSDPLHITLLFGSFTALPADNVEFLGTSIAVTAIDTTPPTVTINQADTQADPTNVSTIHFTARFSEPVAGFDLADVSVTGVTGAAATEKTQIDSKTYDIKVSGMTANGAVVATIAANKVKDLAGNDNTASTSTDNSVTYDTVAPTVTISKKTGQTDPTNVAPIYFTVTFSEPVSELANSGVTVTGATTAQVTGSGTTYEIAVSNMTGSGTVTVGVKADAVQDAAGNKNAASATASVAYDTTPPTVTTIARAASQLDPTNASPIRFKVIFSEPVSELAASGVTVTGATTAQVTGSGTTYEIAVTNMTGSGTVTVGVKADAVQDAAGNKNAASATASVVYDITPPTVTTITKATGQLDPTNASPIRFAVVFSEPVSGFADSGVSVTGTAGATTAQVTGSGTTYEIVVSGMTGSGTVTVGVKADAIQDAVGNKNAASATASVTYDTTPTDTTPPTVTTIARAASQLDPTNASTIRFAVIFSEPVSELAASGVSLTGTAGATTAQVTGSGTTYEIAVSGMTGSGTVTVGVKAEAVQDNAGNKNAVSTTASVTYDATAPTVTVSKKSGQADPTNTSPINFTVIFTEPVFEFATGDVTLGGTAGATAASVTGSGTTYDVAVSGMTGNGTVTVSIPAGAAHDSAGNLNAVSATTSVTYDTTPPDATPPTAALSAQDIATAGGTTYTFSVTYADNAAIRVSTIGDSDVKVTGPGVNQTATLVQVDVNEDGTPCVATYQIAAPGGTWDAASDTGTYTVTMVAGEVKDTSDNAVAAGSLGTFKFEVTTTETIPPQAAATLPVPVAGDTTYTFTVTYIDNVAINLSRLGDSNIRVTSPTNSFEVQATYVSVEHPSERPLWVATYRFAAPGGTWDATDTGGYTVEMRSNQVADASGNVVPSGTIGTFGFNTVIADTAPPRARVTSPGITTGGGTTYDFVVTYIDDRAIDVSRLDNLDVRVRGPSGGPGVLAQYISVSPAGNGSPRLATYRMDAPGGTWDATDFGTYTISMEANQVPDLASNHVLAGEIGTFQVFIGGPVVDLNGPEAGTSFVTAAFTGGPAIKVEDSDATLVDAGGNDINSVVVTITNLLDGTNESLDADVTGTSITKSDYDASKGTLTLSGADTAAHYQQVLRTVTYRNVSANPNKTSREISFLATDTLQSGNTAMATVTMFDALPSDSLAPQARANVQTVPTAGSATYTFSVTYIDDHAMNVSTLGNGDVRVTGPNGYDELATFVSVSPSGNGTPRVGTYTIPAPGGSWDTATDTGEYAVLMELGQVTDVAGNPVPAETLGRFGFNTTVADTVSPRARATTSNVTAAAGTTYTFTVTYIDDVSIQRSTIGDGDVMAVGPNGYSELATFVSVDVDSSGTPRVGTYRVNAAGGAWDIVDNGSYAVIMQSSQVADLAGNVVPAAAIGTFQVAVANPPVLSGIETTALEYTENAAATAITATLVVSDADSANLTGATIQITAGYQSGADLLAFANTATITATWSASTQTLTLTGTDTVANYQAALRAVTYRNTSDNPSTVARTVMFKVSDGTAESVGALRSIAVTATNDVPVLADIETAALEYTENAAAIAITATLTVADVDNTNLTGATIEITAGYQSGADLLSFANTATITGTWSASNQTLTLTGTDTVANYQAALRAVKYRNSSEAPSTATRTVTFKVNDGSANSDPVSRNIAVSATNDVPLLVDILAPAATYTEGAAPTVITTTIAVFDMDSANLVGATIWIGDGFQSGEDVLSFTNTTKITGTWSASNGILTLSGTDTLENYEAALRAVKYHDTSVNPSTATRTVTFQVNDGTANSNTVSNDVTVTAVNDAPVLSGIETVDLSYLKNSAATPITSTLVVSDVDSTNLTGATIDLGDGYQSGEDVLSFADTTTITSTWTASTGTLVLSGTDTVAAYQTALRAVKYQNTSATPNTTARTVTFKVNDDTANSNPVSRNISVVLTNAAPAISDIETTALFYTENDAATAVSATLVVSDVDSASLTGATIKIGDGYQNGADVLTFADTTKITGAWTASTGTLVLSGADTVANYQAALRAVKYQNTSDNPSTTTRTVTLKVNDGIVDSATVSRSIAVTAVNDAPVLSGIETTPLNYTENDVATAITATLAINDVDSTNLTGATIEITAGYQSGEDVLSFTNTTTITGTWSASARTLTLSGSDTVANYQAALRAVKYHNTSDNPSTTARTVAFKVTDGTMESTAVSRNIAVTAVNDVPMLSGIETTALSCSENVATAITATLVIGDLDSTNLTGATIKIGDGYQNGEDILSFTNTTKITGTWSASAQTLTLSGSDTVANYQAALRAVKYQNTSDTPNTTARTVTFKVNDGSDDSAPVSRNITVTAVNDVPLLSGIETTALPYTENDAATAITATLAISDVDSANLTGATIKIGDGYRNGEDILSFTNTTKITGTWTASTATLVLSGTDTVANYQAALRAVKYQNTSGAPSTAVRPVTFKVNDGTADSVQVSRNIAVTAVNTPPTLSAIETTALAYVENAAATVVTATLVVTDPDNTNLTGATIKIGDGYQSGEDILSFTNTTKITGTWSASTGTLVLSGTDTVANYQAALRAVKYQNTSDTPNTTARTVTFKVNDGSDDSAPVSRNITVTAVNDAPALSGANAFSTITEKDTSNTGSLVSALISGKTTDADTNALQGIAVTGLTATNGKWQYSMDAGTTWTDVGTVSATSALLLRSSDKLRFLPNGENGSADTVIFRAWDQTSGTAGTKVDVSTNGGSNAFSSATATSTITVTAVSDAPVLSGANNFTSITTGQTAGSGDLVSTLISGKVSDVDASAQQGIAVSATSASSGKWQYSIDAGATWNDVGTVSESSALLLRSADKLRYVPDGANTSTDTVTFRAWDQTSGTAGTKVDVATNGGTTAFSAATATSTISVVLANASLAGYVYVDSNNDGNITLSNGKQHAVLPGVTLQLTGKDGSGAAISFTRNGTSLTALTAITGSDGYYSFTDLPAGTYQITEVQPSKYRDGKTTAGTLGGSAGVNAISTITVGASQNGTGYNFGERGLTSGSISLRNFLASTLSSSGSVAAQSVAAPVVTLNSSSSTFVSGTPVAIASAATVTHPDGPGAALTSLVVSVTNPRDGSNEKLTADTSNTNITATSSPGALTLSGVDTAQNYQNVLRTVKYQNTATSMDLTARLVRFVALNSFKSSNQPTTTVIMQKASQAVDALMATDSWSS